MTNSPKTILWASAILITVIGRQIGLFGAGTADILLLVFSVMTIYSLKAQPACRLWGPKEAK